jgi:DnaJ-class molecular chaperone
VLKRTGDNDVARNYYVILGIGADATPDQIKSAYREKAKSVHPDCSGGACEPFHDVQQAYEVLSDPARRKVYDNKLASERHTRRQTRRARDLEPEPLIPTERHAGQRPIQDTVYGQSLDALFRDHIDDLWNDFAPWVGPQTSTDQDIHIAIDLSWEQARRGGEVQLRLPVQTTCPTCQGQGGSWFFPCPHCQGSGMLQKAVPLSISFPIGVSDGATARLPLDQLGLHHTSLLVHFRVRW